VPDSFVQSPAHASGVDLLSTASEHDWVVGEEDLLGNGSGLGESLRGASISSSSSNLTPHRESASDVKMLLSDSGEESSRSVLLLNDMELTSQSFQTLFFWLTRLTKDHDLSSMRQRVPF